IRAGHRERAIVIQSCCGERPARSTFGIGSEDNEAADKGLAAIEDLPADDGVAVLPPITAGEDDEGGAKGSDQVNAAGHVRARGPGKTAESIGGARSQFHSPRGSLSFFSSPPPSPFALTDSDACRTPPPPSHPPRRSTERPPP